MESMQTILHELITAYAIAMIVYWISFILAVVVGLIMYYRLNRRVSRVESKNYLEVISEGIDGK